MSADEKADILGPRFARPPSTFRTVFYPLSCIPNQGILENLFLRDLDFLPNEIFIGFAAANQAGVRAVDKNRGRVCGRVL